MTNQQKRVLAELKIWVRKHRTAPTLLELAGVVGTKTASSVLRHVRALEAQGLLTIEVGKKQGIRLTGTCPTCGRPMKA